MDPWVANEAGRKAFADYLETLTAHDWATTSWSAKWDVKAVAAHLLVTQTKGKGAVFVAFASSGFNLDKMNAKYVGELTSSLSPEQIVQATRDSAGVRSAPPGLSPSGVLAELCLHVTDIAEAVGKPFALPPEHYVAVLDLYKTNKSTFGCQARIEGLRLNATDTSWSTGDGPLVEGTAQMLASAMTGRRQALAHLSGPGVKVMSQR